MTVDFVYIKHVIMTPPSKYFALQNVKALHVEDMDVVVEPGIGWMDLNKYLEPYGLFFPLDPGTVQPLVACVLSGVAHSSLPVRFAFFLNLLTFTDINVVLNFLEEYSELLLHANVDTFIVFRSAVPIFVSMEEALYLHQPWPSIRTCLSLSTIFAGCVLYVLTDYQFTLTAYSWALAYSDMMTVGPVHEPIL
ncbi:hypothetical protein IFM89_015638 [Coptis chinensis]|uniref:FAD linked oxidase N-terminal domain-containing protein n=1 Tax=Coptis chinensis TaxID=261450 RepID=A0A835IX32_9MAGN|nr:hypothetical protein IFM89_015638 [Coptis chinensis]